MNWNVLLVFAIVLAVYIVGLVAFSFIKRAYNKKKFKEQEKQAKEIQNESSKQD